MKDPDRGVIFRLAVKHIDATNGNVEKAAERLLKEINGDRRLRKIATDQLLRPALVQMINIVRSHRRHRIWNADDDERDDYEARAEERKRRLKQEGADRLVVVASVRLSEFPLPLGMRLADASRDDIEHAARYYMGRGADLVGKARWLAAIAQRLPFGKTVKQVLTDKDLERIKDDTMINISSDPRMEEISTVSAPLLTGSGNGEA